MAGIFSDVGGYGLLTCLNRPLSRHIGEIGELLPRYQSVPTAWGGFLSSFAGIHDPPLGVVVGTGYAAPTSLAPLHDA